MIEIKIDVNKLDPNHPDYVDQLFDLATQAVVSGSTTKYANGFATYFIESARLPMTLAQGVVALGGEVNKMDFFIKVSAPDDLVPVGVPNREDGEGNILTWNEWKLSTHTFHNRNDGNMYIGANANTGDVVKLNDFVAVFADCIDSATFISMQPEG